MDNAIYCGNRRALDYLSRITDWAIHNLERSRRTADGSTEWYTLSENLYRAYQATGDAKYREFAAVWEYSEYWNIFARRADPFDIRPSGQQNGAYHAYSHVNTLGGAGAAFLVTGNSRYLDILRNAYDYLQGHQVFASGGYGPDEQLLPRDALLARLASTQNSFETQCGSWAGFKMVKHLITLTGDAQYGDWAEHLALNGLAATIPMTSDGRVMYYSNYNTLGGRKHNADTGWTCCTGTRPQAVADICDLLYFHDADSLCVNLFAPSHVNWSQGGTAITLHQVTRFPEEEQVEFRVETDQRVGFGLKLRRPAWLAGPLTARLNGEPISLADQPGHWAVLRRLWKNADRLIVTLPMGLWVSRPDPQKAYPAAILFGPLLLAARASGPAFIEKLDLKHPQQSFIRTTGEPLTWRLSNDPAVLLRPFSAYKEGEPYYVYLDAAAARRVPVGAVTFRGSWNEAAPFRFSNRVGATAEWIFEGTGIRWLGFRFDDAGRAQVRIDGRDVAVVSQYGPGANYPSTGRSTTSSRDGIRSN